MKLLVTLGTLFLAVGAMADTFESGWDRPGYDYANYEMVNPRPSLCQWYCQKDSRCRAWTYVKPGFQGTNARCWLKTTVPAAVKNSCCTSGYIE